MSYLRSGIFPAYFHDLSQNPSLALECDLELVQHLDTLNYNEAWIGEHHSGGYEIIGSPEVFIAAAAERTRHIRLGTGARFAAIPQSLHRRQQMVQLDYQTRGRAMWLSAPDCGGLRQEDRDQSSGSAADDLNRNRWMCSLELFLLAIASPARPTGLDAPRCAPATAPPLSDAGDGGWLRRSLRPGRWRRGGTGWGCCPSAAPATML